MSSPASNAMSAYAPIRRNSFLQHPTAPSTTASTTTALVASRFSTVSLGLFLVLLRFWKDAKLIPLQDVIARLPSRRLRGFLQHALQHWQGTTASFVGSFIRRLLQTLHEQLSPFLVLQQSQPQSQSPNTITSSSSSAKQQRHTRSDSRDSDHSGSHNQHYHYNYNDAPTSILCCDVSASAASTTPFTVTSIISSEYYEDRIRQNQALIHKVLQYWFGQYPPDVAQKQLWMIASSSTQRRIQVDAEIADLFTPLLCELATASSVIDGEDGTVVPCRWKQWCADKDMYGYQGKVAAIIVLDQFSRHIRRHYDSYHQEQEQEPTKSCSSTNNSKTADKLQQQQQQQQQQGISCLPCQTTLDALALRTAQLLTEGHAQEIACGMIPLPYYIFGLMPYRHASTLQSVQYVQTSVEHATNLHLQLEAMTSRFRKATNRRMAVLQDEARRTGKATTTTDVSTSSSTTATNGEIRTGDKTTTTCVSEETVEQPHEQHHEQAQSTKTNTVGTTSYTEEDILETFPFEADMTDAPHHPVLRTIQSFLADRGIHPIAPADYETATSATSSNGNRTNTSSNKKTKPNKKQKGNRQHQQQQQQQQHKAPSTSDPAATEATTPCSVIVSLSGGVDSMVIASVLAFLKAHGGYPHLDIVAIHIDYANRPESKAESDYVQQYCAQHGIRFVVRRIEEVTRGITARDEYEQRARQVRYDLYRKIAQECIDKHRKNDQGTTTTASIPVVGVMLGHHRGDLRENVLSNAHKGCGPLDLSGMTAVSQNDGVTIYRPLLPLEKVLIFEYAHKFGVPYFKDTTPHWSTRGKLRNKLIPLLEEIYGEGSMNNLCTLATESDECRDLLHDALLKPFMDRVVRTPMGIVFETAPFVAAARGVFFWKFVLREVLHSARLGMFSDKSVISFLERIDPGQTYNRQIREGWLQCRRDYAVYLQADGKVFVFYPDSFPWRKSDAYKCTGQVVDLGVQNTFAVGPWLVEAEVCDLVDSDREVLVKKKAISSMEQFMDGFVEYYLEVPTASEKKSGSTDGTALKFTPAPLVVISSFKKATRPPAWKNADEKIQETLPLLGISDASHHELKNRVTENPVAVVRVTLHRRFSTG